MSMLGVSFTINFTVDWEVRLKTWGGRFLNKLVGEVLEGAGVKVSHNEGKPFSISPVLDMNGRIANKLAPGSVYWFRASFMCNAVDCDTVTSAFIRDSYKLSSGEVIRILNVGFYEFEPNNSGANSRSIIEWSVTYYPTVFPFMHHYILHPSPARFFASTAKTLAQLLKGTEVVLDKDGELIGGAINSINTKDLIKDLVFNTELIDFKINKLRISLGRGRSTLAFYGTAEYVTETENISLFNTLLDIAEFFGVGKNKALGFGFVKITQRNIKKPEIVRVPTTLRD
jgi:hypothetical protein